MKSNRHSLVFLFALFLVFFFLVSRSFQEDDKEFFSNITIDNVSIQSSEFLENMTHLEGRFRPVLTFPASDFQGFGDRIFVYYNGTLKVYEIKTGRLLLNITSVYAYYFSNRYAYVKTSEGSFILDYKTLRLSSTSADKSINYAFKFDKCTIMVKERSALVNSQVFTFNATPQFVTLYNGFVIFGLYNGKTKVVFFDRECSLLNNTIISNYPLEYKVVNNNILFIRHGLFSVNQSKFPELTGEIGLHEYLLMSSVYLFNSKGQKIASLELGGAFGFHNGTFYSFKVSPGYCDMLVKFYLLNKSSEKRCFSISYYNEWVVSQGTFGDFGNGFMAFAYWGFSGEVGTSYNNLCVYVYDKRLKCTAYYSKTKRINPIDKIKAWDKYFAIIGRGEAKVVIYEVT